MKIQNNETMPNAVDGSWHAGTIVTESAQGTFEIVIKHGNYIGKILYFLQIGGTEIAAFFASLDSGTYTSATNSTSFLGISYDEGGNPPPISTRVNYLIFIPKTPIATVLNKATILP